MCVPPSHERTSPLCVRTAVDLCVNNTRTSSLTPLLPSCVAALEPLELAVAAAAVLTASFVAAAVLAAAAVAGVATGREKSGTSTAASLFDTCDMQQGRTWSARKARASKSCPLCAPACSGQASSA